MIKYAQPRHFDWIVALPDSATLLASHPTGNVDETEGCRIPLGRELELSSLNVDARSPAFIMGIYWDIPRIYAIQTAHVHHVQVKVCPVKLHGCDPIGFLNFNLFTTIAFLDHVSTS